MTSIYKGHVWTSQTVCKNQVPPRQRQKSIAHRLGQKTVLKNAKHTKVPIAPATPVEL